MSRPGGVTVAVLATRGGPDLERTVEAFGSGSRVVVVDPLRRVSGTGGVGLERHDPVLAVLEGELPTRDLSEAVGTTDAPPGRARVCIRHVGRGWTIEPRGGGLRYGPWGAARFGLGADETGGAVSRLPGALVSEHGGVDTALARLDAVAAALAALLDEADAELGLAATVRQAVRTWTRVVSGASPQSLGWGRWIAAGLLAYRDVLAATKLLELRGRT